MGKAAEKEKTRKKSRLSGFKTGLKAEFGKIIWPDRTALVKQTAAVVVVSVVLGAVIAVVDFLIQHGVDVLVG